MKKQPTIIPPVGENAPQIDAVEILEMEIKDLPISDLKKEILRDSFTEAYETAIPLIQSAMQFVITDESTPEDIKAAERQAAARAEAERLAAQAALNPPIAPPTVNIPRSFPVAPTSETPIFDPFTEFIAQLEQLRYPTNLQGTQAHKVAQVEAQMKQIINWLKS